MLLLPAGGHVSAPNESVRPMVSVQLIFAVLEAILGVDEAWFVDKSSYGGLGVFLGSIDSDEFFVFFIFIVVDSTHVPQ